MKILVTGGPGLIGSYLCEELLKDGHSVICFDNLQSGNFDNIEHLLLNNNFLFFRIDTTTDFLIEEIDQIYNLASPTAPSHFKSNPIDTIYSNVVGTVNILELAKERNIPVVHISSIRVLEASGTFNDSACYVESKRCSETICYEYRKQGVNVKVARLFNVYGERMRPDDSRVIPQFIFKALKGEDLQIFGDGYQMDSFSYVTDIIHSLIYLMNDYNGFPIVHLGSGEFINIQDLAKMVIDATGSKSNPHYTGMPVKFFNRSIIQITDIGYKHKITLKEGIKIMSDCYSKGK